MHEEGGGDENRAPHESQSYVKYHKQGDQDYEVCVSQARKVNVTRW